MNGKEGERKEIMNAKKYKKKGKRRESERRGKERGGRGRRGRRTRVDDGVRSLWRL